MTPLNARNLSPTAPDVQQSTPPEDPPVGDRMRGVLVIDDQDFMRNVLDYMLRSQGFAVWLAADGWEAIDLYRRHRASIDLVLLDVCMPVLDGPATLAALRELDPQVGCCFMTGDPGKYTERELRELAGAALLLKPFRLADLSRVVREFASRAPGCHT